MKKTSRFCGDLLNIRYPVFQAPMAGVTTPELVSAVSNSGGLGNLAVGYVQTKETKKMIQAVKKLTTQPFGINLFVPEGNDVTEAEIERSAKQLSFSFSDLQLEKLHIQVPKLTTNFEEQIDIVIEEKVDVCSFTFGIPNENIIKRLQKEGIFVIGTATTVREAQAIERAGMDAVVVQGSEAGGHRGTFLGEESYVGLMSLIPQVVDNISIPVIAAGGIMDGRGVNASLCLGAEAAQLGTAFLTTKESSAHPLHKQSILEATEEDLQFTRAFSGKTARGIRNKFTASMERYKNNLLAFPHQNSLTNQIRSTAMEQNNKDYMSLWSGQSPRLSRDLTVKELIKEIINDLE